MPLSSLAAAPFLVRRPAPPTLVDRAAELELLHVLLQGDERAVGLVGPSGVGKTAIALAYARRYKAEYPGGVIWIDAAQGLEDELDAQAGAIGIEAKGPPADHRRLRIIALGGFLRDRSNALLIIDGVDDARVLHAHRLGFVPAELPCRLLFTTRAKAVDETLPLLEVGALPENAALTLLLAARPSAPTEGAARSLVAALRCEPLALSIASAWLAFSPARSVDDLVRALATLGPSGIVELGLRDVLAPNDLRVLELIALFGEGRRLSAAQLALLAGYDEGGSDRVAEAIGAIALRGLASATPDGAEVWSWPAVRSFVRENLSHPDGIARRATAALAGAFADVDRLDREVAGRGISAILEDLRIAAALSPLPLDLASLRATLELEAPSLVSPSKLPSEPTFFLQQLHARASDLGHAELAARTRAALARRLAPYLVERARTSHPGEASSRVLEGHTAKVNAVAITDDGRLGLSASDDRTVRVWDLESGRALFVLTGHVAAVRGVAISADARLAISAAMDDTLIVWDLASARPARFLRAHKGVVHGVAISKSGEIAVSASEDRTLRVWNPETGELRATLQGHRGGVHGVALSEDGRLCASASWDDAAVRLWAVDEGSLVREIGEPRAPISALAMTPAGDVVVAASFEASVLRWSPFSAEPPEALTGHDESVTSVAMTSDARLAVSASWDHTVRVWDLEGRRAARVLHGHLDAVWGVAITPDGRRVVSGSEDCSVRVWDLRDEPLEPSIRSHEDRVSALASSSSGHVVVSASFDDTALVWDASRAEVTATLEGHTLWVYGVALDPDGRRVISASLDGSVRIWDVKNGRQLASLSGLSGRSPGVTIPAAGGPLCAPFLVGDGAAYVITSTDDGDLAAWSLDGGARVRTFLSPGAVLSAASLVAGRLVAGAADGRLFVWDASTGARLCEGLGHAGPVRVVVSSEDGGVVVTGSEDRTVRVWDPSTLGLVAELSGHGGPVVAAALSREGRLLATAAEDRTLRIWDLRARSLVARMVLRDVVDAVVMLPDARTLVAGDRAGHVHFLSLEGHRGVVRPDEPEREKPQNE